MNYIPQAAVLCGYDCGDEMKEKRKVCLVTNWYPTRENPYVGCFFKEQAFALSDYFDFIVIHYTENNKVFDPVYWLRSLRGKNFFVQKVNEEGNTVEYAIHGQLPVSTMLIGLLDKIYRKITHKQIPGSEMHETVLYRKQKKKLLERIFKTGFPESFDVLYCVSAQTESGMLKGISEIAHKPYIVAEHGPFPWPGSTIKSDEKVAIEKADAFLAISYDKIRQVLLQNVRPKRIAYVGNMVDEGQFTLGEGSGREKTFVIVAAHSFYKNYPLFIEVFERLVEITNVPFKVMIVGYNANKGYSVDADVLEQRIRSSHFASHAELIPAVSREEMPGIYGRADAFVMTSIQEGMPVSALEAGCCGLPIFSTMCGGVEDYVDDSMGRIFRIIDSKSFAQGLKAYLEGQITFDPQHIRQQVVSRYGKKAFTENMAAIFNEVIDNHQNTVQ